MSAVIHSLSAVQKAQPSRVTLLGTGTVGHAFVQRHHALLERGVAVPALAAIANTRGWQDCEGRDVIALSDSLRALTGKRDARRLRDAVFGPGDIVVDATACFDVADRHAEWLRAGAHVVTACKIGQGTSLARWRAIRDARIAAGTQYGDSATVGAGLPILRSLRELERGGDRIHSIAGVVSGSLAWLFSHYDGVRHFSGWVRQARDAGYTEPDPRDDLSGEDVRRKLLILTRAIGVELDVDDVEVESLVPAALADLPLDQLDDELVEMDAAMWKRRAVASRKDEVLRYVARYEHGKARVGLESLPRAHPLAVGAGTDNRVAIWSDRYDQQPLTIQGPGAGAGVTAAALMDDVLRIAG